MKLIYRRRKCLKLSKNNFNSLYKFYTNEIERKISQLNSHKTEKLINKSKTLKEFYKSIRRTTEPQKSVVFNILGSKVSNAKVITEKFSEHFNSVENKRELDFSNLNFDSVGNNVLKECPISMNDVLNSMKEFNCNKSEGPTFIPNKTIKCCINGISKFLFILFNYIINFEMIPNELKLSRITPLLKKG